MHQRQTDGGLRELHKATGGAWGGTKVDEEFNQMLIKIVGAPVLHKFRTEHTGDYLDLQRELEMKKRTINPATKGKITVKIPIALYELYKSETDESIEEAIEGSPFKDKLIWLADKVRIDAGVFKDLFKHCREKIVDHVKNLMQNTDVQGTKTLLMVGGFSDSEMIQDVIQKAFPNYSVIIPEDAGLCVLKGAVIFGHRPIAITSRMSRYTYGINISPPYEATIHSADHKVVVGGTERCRDVFKKYINEGEEIQVGEVRSGKHVTLSSHQTEMLLKIYASIKPNPVYVDEEGSEYLGQVVVKIPDNEDKIRVEVKMMFGETELSVEAEEMSTNNKFTSYFDFL